MKIHVVQKGDTLWELAKQYDVDFEELKQLNPQLSSPDMVMPGMKIKIPSSAKSVQKEEVKETQKPEAVHPYKEMQQPKPVPIMKEDEKEKQKQVQPHMPMQPQMPKEQQKKPSIPQQTPEQPQMPAPHQPVPAPQMTNQQVQPIIQMPIMEQELKNYTSVNIPEMPHYEKPKEEQPIKHEKPMPQPMPQPMQQHPMPQPVAMVPVCCQVMPPGAMPMPHQHFQAAGAYGNGAPYGEPIQPGYTYPMHHPHFEHGMMESPSIEMPVKPSLTKSDKDCGCNGKKTMPEYDHQGHNMNQHHQPYYSAPSHPFQSSSFGSNDHHSFHGYSDKPQVYPSPYGAMPNDKPFPAPPGYPDFSGAGYRAEEDESTGE